MGKREKKKAVGLVFGLLYYYISIDYCRITPHTVSRPLGRRRMRGGSRVRGENSGSRLLPETPR